jgi:NAD(P)-dependent dehydrogenase (short-subunit alcohol dehydrogenase family)
MAETVLITGGSSGIGKAAAFLFAKKGYTVLINGRDQTKGQQVVDAIKVAGGQAKFLQADVSDPNAVKSPS